MQLQEVAIDVVGDDHAIVNCPEPAGHDDSNAAGVVETADLVRQTATHREPFKFGSKTGAFEVLRVVLESSRCGGFDVIDSFPNVGYVSFDVVERIFAKVSLAGLVLVFG